MTSIDELLRQLKLGGAHEALKSQRVQMTHYHELSFEERLQCLLEHEITQREQRKIQRLTKLAKFRLMASIEHIDYQSHRNLEKAKIRSLAQGEWLRQHQNILITGATGCGKTYISCALGFAHCQQGFHVNYFRLKELLEMLTLAQAQGGYRKLLHKLQKTDLLIIDDWGLDSMTMEQRSNFLELIDTRYGYKSTLISSQLPVEHWHEMIGESTHADAILDRLVHGSIKIELHGESMRKIRNNLTSLENLG